MPHAEIAALAFERAWRVYRMINSHVEDNDVRRATLERFIRRRCEAGATDTELLVVEALKHLKRLDEYGEFD